MCAVLALAACAPLRTREGTAAQLVAQAAREQDLRAHASWSLNAHFAVSDGQQGGSGNLDWRQNGANYHFVLRAPVTGKSFSLDGGPGGATLAGMHPQPVRGDDAQALLAHELGWLVPVSDRAVWVRGLRAPGSAATLSFGDDGLPSLLQQDGWTVEYRDWYADQHPPLPRKVFASKPPYSVRMLIETWKLQ